MFIITGTSVQNIFIRSNFTANNVIDFYFSHFTSTTKPMKVLASHFFVVVVVLAIAETTRRKHPRSRLFVPLPPSIAVNYVAANEIFYYYHRNFSTFSLRCTLSHSSFLKNFPFILYFAPFVIVSSILCFSFSVVSVHDISQTRALASRCAEVETQDIFTNTHRSYYSHSFRTRDQRKKMQSNAAQSGKRENRKCHRICVQHSVVLR